MHMAQTVLPSEMVGHVSEIEPTARCIVVQSNSRVKGARELNLRVGVTEMTSVREGKADKRFEDIKVGDKVWLKCERKGDMVTAALIIIKGHDE